MEALRNPTRVLKMLGSVPPPNLRIVRFLSLTEQYWLVSRYGAKLPLVMTALGIPLNVQKLLDNQRIKLAAASVPESVGAVSTRVKQAVALAFVDSFRLVMFIAVGLALLSALIALLIIKKKTKNIKNETRKRTSNY